MNVFSIFIHSSNMKKINNMRATFLYERFKRTQFDINVVSMLNELFIDDPSLTRTIDCMECGFHEKTSLPVLQINNDTFNGDISNIEIAIRDNLLDSVECKGCEERVETLYQFEKHLFVEVSSGSYTENETNYEPSVSHKFADIPVSIFDNRYILVAAFLYYHGAYDNDIGHYKVAIKINEKWELFDDYEPKTKELSNNHRAVIHALMYVKNEAESESQNEAENEKESEEGSKKVTKNLKRKQHGNKKPQSATARAKKRKI